jgi:hypothetical protein
MKDEKITIKEFEKQTSQKEEELNDVDDFVASLSIALRMRLDTFKQENSAELFLLKNKNANQEQTITRLNDKVDVYKQRLLQLQKIINNIDTISKDEQAELSYFARP